MGVLYGDSEMEILTGILIGDFRCRFCKGIDLGWGFCMGILKGILYGGFNWGS